MNPVEIACLVIVAIMITWFMVSGYYDLKVMDLQKALAKEQRRCEIAEFRLGRYESVREEFEKECG